MKILVKSRRWIEAQLKKDPEFHNKGNFISIYSSKVSAPLNIDFSPLPNGENILKLQFDDLTIVDKEYPTMTSNPFIWFSEELGNKIKSFVLRMEKDKILYVHCDAGISRSGAVGSILNEYFNAGTEDFKEFYKANPNIAPNSLVVSILRSMLLVETNYSEIFK